MKRLFLYSIIILCRCISYAQVVNEPTFERMSYEVRHPHIDKVEIMKDTTKVYCTINFEESWGYNIPRNMHIEDIKTKKKYFILRCEGLPFEPEERLCSYGGKFQFVFCFPHIENLNKFNLIEDDQNYRFFNFYGVNLSDTYSDSFDEHDYNRYKNMSNFYMSANDNDKYLDFEKKELEVASYLFGTKSMAATLCYQQLSYLYSELGDYSMAIQFGLKELECDSIHLGVNNKDFPVYATALSNIASNYSRAGNEPLGIAYQNKAIGNRKVLADSDKYLFELEMMAIGGISFDRVTIVENELNCLPEFVDTTSIAFANVLKALAVRYETTNEYNKALSYCNSALLTLNTNKTENVLRIADVQGRMCRYKRYLNLYQEAITIGERAKKTLDSLQVKPNGYINILEDLSWCYGVSFDYEKAIFFQKQIVDLCLERKDWLSLAEAYNYIGHYYQQAEDLVNAERFTIKAIEVLNSHDDAEKILRDDIELTGGSYYDYSNSLPLINQMINYIKGNSYQGLARIYQKEGKISEAIITEKKNGELFKSNGKDKELYALSLLNLSEYYLRDKQYNNAISYVEQCLNVDVDRDNSPLKTKSNFIFALIHNEKGEAEKAIRYAEESISISKKFGYFEDQLLFQPLLSRLYWMNGNYKSAEQCMSEILSILQDTIRSNIKEMTTEQKQRMWSRFEPNFFFYRSIIDKSEKNGPLISKLYNYLIFSKSLLLDSDIHGKNELSRLSISWKNIQQHLSDDDIAIEFFVTPNDSVSDTYHALIINKDCDYPNMITLYNESDFENIKQKSEKPIIDLLGELIWKPIIKQYGEIKNYYFSSEGIINILPIEYSKLDGIGEIMDYYNLYRLSSTKELVFQKKKNLMNNAVLYGGLDYNVMTSEANNDIEEKRHSLLRSINARGGFEPLYSTKEEVKEIANILEEKEIPTTLYTGDGGTEKSFKSLSDKSINMLHLSTHGMYVPPNNISQKKKENNFDFLEIIQNYNDPVKEDVMMTHSFLVMSGGNEQIQRKTMGSVENDGILTASEISNVGLGQVDLVVLSACETGLGYIDSGGVYGLQRGFKKAGVNTILMSLDKVDDEATKILMVEFYRNLMGGKTKLKSLKDAQKYLRQVYNGRYDKPEYWASFIMLDGLN